MLVGAQGLLGCSQNEGPRHLPKGLASLVLPTEAALGSAGRLSSFRCRCQDPAMLWTQPCSHRMRFRLPRQLCRSRRKVSAAFPTHVVCDQGQVVCSLSKGLAIFGGAFGLRSPQIYDFCLFYSAMFDLHFFPLLY